MQIWGLPSDFDERGCRCCCAVGMWGTHACELSTYPGPAEAGDGFRKESEEQPAVAVIQENVLPGVAARRRMIDGVGIFDAQGPRHGGNI